MVVKQFPPVETADSDGFLGIGGDVDPETIILAYKSGIFLWPPAPNYLAWFSPPRRTVLFLKDFKVNSRLVRDLKSKDFELRVNSSFDQVIHGCSQPRVKQKNTWITKEVIDGFLKLNKLGYAHSFETYSDDKLVGGLYGMSIGGMFAGESMFSFQTSASKFALVSLVEFLKKQNVPWIDCQVMTPLFKSFGAVEIERSKFIDLLNIELSKPSLKFEL